LHFAKGKILGCDWEFILYCTNTLIKGHVLLDLSNGSTRVETLGAGLCAVHDGVATVDGIFVLKLITTFSAELITRVSHPAVSLHEHSRAEVLVLVPPVRWAGGRAASTQDTFVQSIQLLTVLNGLQVLLTLWWTRLLLEVRLNALVLLIEVGQVGNEILDDVHYIKKKPPINQPNRPLPVTTLRYLLLGRG
jgi:hypothetical protein